MGEMDLEGLGWRVETPEVRGKQSGQMVSRGGRGYRRCLGAVLGGPREDTGVKVV